MKFIAVLFLAVLVGYFCLPLFHVYDLSPHVNMKVDYSSGRAGTTTCIWLSRQLTHEGKVPTLIFGALILLSASCGIIYALFGKKRKIIWLQLIAIIGLVSCIFLRSSSFWYLGPEDRGFISQMKLTLQYSYGYYMMIAGFVGAFLVAQVFETSSSKIDNWRFGKSV